MNRFLFFAFIALAAAATEDEKQKCRHALHPSIFRCCVSAPNERLFLEKAKECDSLPKDPVACDHEMCVAKATGFITESGDMDKDKARELLEKTYAGEPAILNAIKSKCFDGDISIYGPPDFCDLLKFKMCYRTQVFANCKEWNNSGDCKGVKELSEECNKIFS